MEPTFTIKTTANITNLNAHTIRAWERRYKALEPDRHGNGRRLYSNDDIKRLKLLSTLVEKGHAISSIAALSTEMLESMNPTLPDAVAKTFESQPSAKGSYNDVANIVLDHCLRSLNSYDLVHINSELESARLLFSAKDFVLLLALPLLQKVGELIACGKISVGQEHALSAVLRSHLMQILFNARNSLAVRSFTRKDLPQGKVFAIATQEGDFHEFGALASAILVAVNGHIPHYFGPNMPVKPLADAANAINSDVCIVGVTYRSPEMRSLSDTSYAEILERELMPKTAVWWGGRPQLDSDFLQSHPRQRVLKSLHQLDEILVGC